MTMTIKQEKEHLDFLITRLQFMKVNANFTECYHKCRESLKHLKIDLEDLEKEMSE